MTSQKCLSEELIENRCYLRQQLLQLDKWKKLANEVGRNSLNKRSNSLKISEKLWKFKKRHKTMHICISICIKIFSENNFHWNKGFQVFIWNIVIIMVRKSKSSILQNVKFSFVEFSSLYLFVLIIINSIFLVASCVHHLLAKSSVKNCNASPKSIMSFFVSGKKHVKI